MIFESKNVTLSALALAAALIATSFDVQPARAGGAEVATAAGCLSAGDPTAIAACTAAGFTINEAQKCIVSGGKDCFGPNNDLVKTVDRTIVGPAKDIASGELGRSDQSVWRKIGLPRVRLW
ncbi:hypothetical protein [Bradyrhizobium sp. USDA 329]|uniref:hypothetical protein n=1 Tax=unclassified Bradyrhizobium TaxID=2631580 RepID=UPI0035115ED2